MLEEDGGDAIATVEWWFSSTTFGDFTGQPVGPPEWPLPGGMLGQPAVLVEAAWLLRAEWPHVTREKASGSRSEEAPADEQRPRRRRR